MAPGNDGLSAILQLTVESKAFSFYAESINPKRQGRCAKELIMEMIMVMVAHDHKSSEDIYKCGGAVGQPDKAASFV